MFAKRHQMTGKTITWWSSNHLSSWISRYSVKIHPFSHCKFIMTSAFSQTLLSAGVSSGSRGLHTAPCNFRPCVLTSRTFGFLLLRQNLVTGETRLQTLGAIFLSAALSFSFVSLWVSRFLLGCLHFDAMWEVCYTTSPLYWHWIIQHVPVTLRLKVGTT